MTYEIILRRSALKALGNLPDVVYLGIAKTISELEQNPRPAKVKKLSSTGLWRVRAGNYRMVYFIDDENKQVIIVRIAKRNEATYKGL